MKVNDEYQPLYENSNNDDNNNQTPVAKLNNDRELIKKSCGRWFVLFVFSMVAICQAMTWMILGPNSREFTRAYGDTVMNSSFISWATNAANISFLLFTWPNAALVKKYGPAFATRFSIVLTFVGCILRCIPWPTDQLFQFFMILSMILIGIAGPWANFGGPTMSSLWFPVNERITSQAIASVSTFLGAVAAFVIGPMITVDNTQNNVKSQQQRIFKLYYVEAGITLFTLVCAFVYFPNQPTYPPSKSAALNRHNAKHGPKNYSTILETTNSHNNNRSLCFTWNRLCSKRMRRFFYLNVAISLPLGLYQGWSSILDLNLREYGITTVESAWIGCWMTLSGCIASVIVARYTDHFVGKLKTCCVLSLFFAATFLLLFNEKLASIDRGNQTTTNTTNTTHTVTTHEADPWLYFTIICAGFFTNISIPLQFELVAESVYGFMSESRALAICTITNTILQIIMLAIPTNLNGTSAWMSWTFLLAIVICVFMMTVYKVEYRRLKLDIKQHSGEGKEQTIQEEVPVGHIENDQNNEKEIGFWFDRFGLL